MKAKVSKVMVNTLNQEAKQVISFLLYRNGLRTLPLFGRF